MDIFSSLIDAPSRLDGVVHELNGSQQKLDSEAAHGTVAAMREQFRKNQQSIESMAKELALFEDTARALGNNSEAEHEQEGAGVAPRQNKSSVGVSSSVEKKSNATFLSEAENVSLRAKPKPKKVAPGCSEENPFSHRDRAAIDYELMRRVLTEQEQRAKGELRAGGMGLKLGGGMWRPEAGGDFDEMRMLGELYGPRRYLKIEFWQAMARRYLHIWLPMVVMVYFNRNAIYFCLQIIFVGPEVGS